MRDQARQLDENQKKLTEQLEAAKERAPRHSLRDTGERKQVTRGPRPAAETARPASRADADAPCRTPRKPSRSWPRSSTTPVRKATEQKIPDALKAAEQLVDLGVTEDAAKASRHAGQGSNRCAKVSNARPGAYLAIEDGCPAPGPGRSSKNSPTDVDQEIAQATGQEPPTTQGANSQKVKARLPKPKEIRPSILSTRSK